RAEDQHRPVHRIGQGAGNDHLAACAGLPREFQMLISKRRTALDVVVHHLVEENVVHGSIILPIQICNAASRPPVRQPYSAARCFIRPAGYFFLCYFFLGSNSKRTLICPIEPERPSVTNLVSGPMRGAWVSGSVLSKWTVKVRNQ